MTDVRVERATEDQRSVLENLLELYVHDLSEVFPHVELGPDGRFGYPKLSLYFPASELRFAYLIRCDERVAGLALVTRGSPALDDPDVFDVAEFFVLRQYRRRGVGQRAASLVWALHPGRWLVRVSLGNGAALPFWAGAVADFTHGAATEFERPGAPHAWRVFSFDSPGVGVG